MAQKRHNQLACLMECFNITGRELANSLHVDYTLVSKWKNSKRPFSVRSNYIKKITDYFLSLDSITGSKRIKEILMEYYPEIDSEPSKAYSSYLCRWLTEAPQAATHISSITGSENKNMYTASFAVYNGNDGRREAVLNFLDYAISLPEGQQLLLISREDMSWMVEDHRFLDTWKRKMTEVIHNKNKITVIHTVDRNAQELAPILMQWMPLHMTGSIDPWYNPQYTDTALKSTLFIIEGAAVITGMTAEGFSKQRYTSFNVDPFTVAHCESVFKLLLSKCRPLLEIYPLSSPYQLYKRIHEAENKSSNSFLHARLPMLSTMPETTLRDILSENNIDPKSSDKCLSIHLQSSLFLHRNLQHCRYRHIYDLNSLEQMAASERVNYYDLSVLTGCEINVSRKHFREHLQNLLNLLENYEGFEVALISNPDPQKQLFNLWIKENSIVLASTTEPSQMLLFAASYIEPTIVNAFFQYYQNIWNSIPRIYRKKEWVVETLKRLISSQ